LSPRGTTLAGSASVAALRELAHPVDTHAAVMMSGIVIATVPLAIGFRQVSAISIIIEHDHAVSPLAFPSHMGGHRRFPRFEQAPMSVCREHTPLRNDGGRDAPQ